MKPFFLRTCFFWTTPRFLFIAAVIVDLVLLFPKASNGLEPKIEQLSPGAAQPLPPITFHTISGMLTDKNGKPLSGWQVLIYGTNVGNGTYPDGHFSLDVPNQPVMVSISYHATPTIFVVVNPAYKALNIKLDEKTEQLAKQNKTEWDKNSKYNFKRNKDLYESNDYRRYMGWYPKNVSDDSILNEVPPSISQSSRLGDKIYKKPQVPPKLAGKFFDWSSFVATEMKYPAEAKREGLRGKVFIGFIIEKDGSVGEVIILKGLRGDCNEAAIGAVKLSKWTPGMSDGVPVRCFHSLTVDFFK